MVSRVPPRRAKIVCTVGPATDSPGAIRALVDAGMDVARLNFSHGTREEHARRAEWIRAASLEAERPVALLQDLAGPEIRTGDGGPSAVRTGDALALVPGERAGQDALAVDYPHLARDLERGDRILLADGRIELRVQSAEGERVLCRVEHGGPLRPRMGVNLPSGRVELPAITEGDREDIRFGLELGVDWMALSFVRGAEEVHELRRLCAPGDPPPPIVAKIETTEAVENLEAVADAADALMLARGDLGVELPPEKVPVVQKRVLAVCRERRRPVIVATEMLQSMVHAARPTRAEASDVANAVFDGADAVMLSAETAVGDDPARACAMLARIVREAEAHAPRPPLPRAAGLGTPEAVARAACGLAEELAARWLVVLTTSGHTARLVSKARPAVPALALSPRESTLRQSAFYWGIEPQRGEVARDPEQLVADTCAWLRERRRAEDGDRVVLVFGTPIGAPGSTNAIRVAEIGPDGSPSARGRRAG